MYRQTIGWTIFSLLVSSSIISTVAYPNTHPVYRPIRGVQEKQQNEQTSYEPQNPIRVERKFAEKPNSIKKVALDDLDDIQTNEISQSSGGGGFSWSNLLGTSNLIPSITGMLMQMIFNPGGGAAVGPNKSENLDDGPVAPASPWANLLSVGLKILTAILGGGGAATPSDGIDKVDNGGSPLQGVLTAVVSTLVGGRDPQQVNMLARQAGEFINIVVNLLDALKTSFSHRSMAARNIGRKDSVSDAALASITMMKGYVRSLGTEDSKCMAKYLCQANNECSTDVGQTSLFCHLGSYAASFVLDKSTAATTFDMLYEAGRRGRSGDNCQQAYLECNEV